MMPADVTPNGTTVAHYPSRCGQLEGCCDACGGTGLDGSAQETCGRCWDCYGTGHCHELPASSFEKFPSLPMAEWRDRMVRAGLVREPRRPFLGFVSHPRTAVASHAVVDREGRVWTYDPLPQSNRQQLGFESSGAAHIPAPELNSRHGFEPGYTGRTCERLYLDADGAGAVCGLGASHPVHTTDH